MAKPLTRRADLDDEEPPEPWQALAPAAHSRAVAEYLGDMINELESLSRRAGLELLTYLLSMARVEAQANARAANPRDS